MRGGLIAIAASLGLMPVAAPVSGRFARPPILVGSPEYPSSPACQPVITSPGGNGPGAAVPIPALAPGAPVERNPISFPTGGSATAIHMLEAQRRGAGLQYEPKVFDPRVTAVPFVFAETPSPRSVPPEYQRLLLKPVGPVTLSYGLIFAQPTLPKAGRIISTALTLASKPTAPPKIMISQSSEGAARCPEFAPIAVYAPAMTVARLHALSTASRCNWFSYATCDASAWPRGRVLFVQRVRSGIGFEHRWVDYDLLAIGRRGVRVSSHVQTYRSGAPEDEKS